MVVDVENVAVVVAVLLAVLVLGGVCFGRSHRENVGNLVQKSDFCRTRYAIR